MNPATIKVLNWLSGNADKPSADEAAQCCSDLTELADVLYELGEPAIARRFNKYVLRVREQFSNGQLSCH